LIKYKNADYVGAIPAFERASILDQTSLTSRYYLGLAYEKSGRIDDENKLFRALAKQLPENQDLKKIIANLDAGRSATDGFAVSDTTTQTPAPTLTPAPASSITPITAPKK
jgi:tetratricopeptide (TPR) repeat protein